MDDKCKQCKWNNTLSAKRCNECYDHDEFYPKDPVPAPSASANNAEAEMLFRQGNDAYNAKNNQRAVELFRRAADMGHSGAQSNLGLHYENGEGVPQDYAKAIEWYRKAAAQGYALAQCNLGNMYYNGNGVAQDDAKAIEWYRKAAAQGNAQAKEVLDWYKSEGYI